MLFVFYILAALLVFLSWKSFRGGAEYLRFFENELAKPPTDFRPFVSIIAPCRGLDDELEKNLGALFRLNYPRYEIIFVVDSETDEAFEVIKKLISHREKENTEKSNKKSPDSPNLCGLKLIVAGESQNESQKVHNLREAVLHAARESEIFVFVDSDARPSAKWLGCLVAPLENEKIGAVTGYRWFISKNIGFASDLRSVWNASIASALGANLKGNFCWGGSMAVRRETFENLNLREKWRGTLSDDFAVTRAMNEHGLDIFFVPQALTASVENCGFRELFEFTTRQMKITRVYAPHLWKMSFVGAGLFNLVMIWGSLILVSGQTDSFAFWAALTALALVALFSIGKSYLRLKAVRLVLTDYERELKKQSWTQNTLWIFSPALFFFNCVSALFSRKIVWRGIEYELKSPTETLRTEK